MTKVYYKNTTDKKISRSTICKIKKVIKLTVEESYPDHLFEVSVTICDDTYIHQLNKEYRGKDKSTDVLSFPMLEFDTPNIVTLLGDIVISVDTAEKQAQEFGNSLERELCFLAVHSSLHLLGYDHETSEEDEKYMLSKQKEILGKAGL